MFSSSVLNITAGCFSPTTDYYNHPPQQQYLQESTYSDLFSGHESSISGSLFHHYPTPPLALDVQDADDDHVPDIFTTVNSCSVENTPMYVMPEQSAGAAVAAASKRSDNRSKIRTAQGLRDRRVRLSIGTARKFFDLQDLLGFDKPSGTLEWLLKKSNKAILKLSAGSSSSTTSSEASSRRDDDGCKISLLSSSPSTTATTYSSNQTEGMSSGASLKTTKHKKALLMAKESRAKARARARARTVAKLNHQQLQLLKNPVDKISRGDQTSYSSSPSCCHNNLSPPSTGIFESGKEEHRHEQKQQLSLHNHSSGIKSNYCWSGFNASLPLDHHNNISNVFPQPSASVAHQLNLWFRDRDTNGQARWDYN